MGFGGRGIVCVLFPENQGRRSEEDAMGDAPKIIEELRQTREQMRENERQWFLDTATGELKPEADPLELAVPTTGTASAAPRPRPQPVRVARQTTD